MHALLKNKFHFHFLWFIYKSFTHFYSYRNRCSQVDDQLDLLVPFAYHFYHVYHSLSLCLFVADCRLLALLRT